MATRIRLIALLVAATLFAPTAGADESVESARKAIGEHWAKYDSFSATLKMEQIVDMPGSKMTIATEGVFEFMRDGGKNLYRVDFVVREVRNPGNAEMIVDQEVTMIGDGEFVYYIRSGMRGSSAVKTNPAGVPLDIVGAGAFDTLAQRYTLKRLPDEKIDGKAVYVVEGIPKVESRIPEGKMTAYFYKDTGVVAKSLSVTPEGKTLGSMTCSNIKINPKLDRRRFVFKAPEGVELVDRTQPPAPKAPEAPKVAPRKDPPVKETPNVTEAPAKEESKVADPGSKPAKKTPKGDDPKKKPTDKP